MEWIRKAMRCAILAMMLLVTPARAQGFHVGILGDRTGGADPEVFDRVVSELERLHPDWIICVGDLIEGPQPDAGAVHSQWDLVLKSLNGLSVPLFFVPGNNDIFNPDSRRIYPERTGFAPYYSFDHEKTHWVVLDNSEAIDVEGMGRDQLQWLAEDLKNARSAELTCVVFHKPFWYEAFDAGKSDPLHELFKANGVDWVFTGHYHSYAYTQKDGIQYVLMGSSGGRIGANPDRGEFYQFGWFTVRNGEGHFALIRQGAVLPADFITLQDRMVQDRVEDDFPELTPAVQGNRDYGGCALTLSWLDVLEEAAVGRYSWDFANSTWIISPAEGSYEISPGGTWTGRFETVSTGSVYPLPRLVITCPIPGNGSYRVTRRLPVVRKLTVPEAISPVIDGSLDDPCWRMAAVVEDFGAHDGDACRTEPFRIRMTHDGNRLYLASEAVESIPREMLAAGGERDGGVFRGDCVYFIFWNNDSPADLVQLIINPEGILTDLKGKADSAGRPGLDRGWNGDIALKTGSFPNGWILEFSLPLSDLNIPEGFEDYPLRMNAIRRQNRLDELSVWHWPATYSPENSGFVLLKSSR